MVSIPLHRTVEHWCDGMLGGKFEVIIIIHIIEVGLDDSMK